MQDEMIGTGGANMLAQSASVHRADANAVGHNIHAASLANSLSFGLGAKSRATYRGHRYLHRAVNHIKHEVFVADGFGVHMPPPPIVQDQGFNLEDPAILAAFKDRHVSDAIIAEAFWRFSGSGFKLRAGAPEFVPSRESHIAWTSPRAADHQRVVDSRPVNLGEPFEQTLATSFQMDVNDQIWGKADVDLSEITPIAHVQLSGRHGAT